MKETVRRLMTDYKDLKEVLYDLRKNKNYSLRAISSYFTDLGYVCSESTIRRLFNSLKVEITTRDNSGENNSFYGKVHSADTRHRMTIAAKSSGRSVGTNNYFYGKTGSSSPNWKGGTSTKRALFYDSELWASKRKEIFARDKFTCRLCGFTPSKERKSLNAHHIIPLYMNWDLCLESKNIITLCVPCHKKTFSVEEQFISIFQDIVRSI